MPHDLTAARAAVQQHQCSAVDFLGESLACADAPVCQNAFVRRFDDPARAAAQCADALHRSGAPLPPLAGLAVSVKDLFDVEGFPTTAASEVLRGAQPAASDCPAVARLRVAGAALVGHTNMTEFAFSGVGTNPHHGTPVNVATQPLDTQARIPGGSTSGGATSVAGGAAWAALGSDTGGSIRIPAALQGLVGFKNTARLTPTQGTIPLSPSLDTACAITRSVRDAILMHEVLAACKVTLLHRTVAGLRLGVPAALLNDMDAHVANAFDSALRTLSSAGAQITDIALPEIDELADINRTGGLSAAESWAWHQPLISRRQADYDARVAARIRRGEKMTAADYIRLVQARSDWIARMNATLDRFDAMLSPTVPIVAPTIESISEDDAFFATNALLLRNPSVVNMLDGCALSLPIHRPGEWPAGLMIWNTGLQDDKVLDLSLAVEHTLTPRSH